MELSKYRGYGTSPVGLHWVPGPYHDRANLTPFLDRLVQMGVRWATVMDDGGGSSLQPNAHYGGKSIIQMLRERLIEPVVRIHASPQAQFDARMKETAERLVKADARWLFIHNEPEVGGTEWGEHGMPKNWVEVVTRNCVSFAYQAIPLGIYPGFWASTTWRYLDPDGQLINPYLAYMTKKERDDLFRYGPCWKAIHPYAKNHPIDFPLDPIHLLGRPLTHAEYLAALAEVDESYRLRTGDMWVWDDHEVDEYHINFVRKPHPGASIETDDVCFHMHQGEARLWAEAGLSGLVPFIATELGPCVGERDDGCYPRITPQQQIRMIDAELKEALATPHLFALTFWHAGNARLETPTKDSFEDQGWWTDRHNEPFNLAGEMPIVPYLIDHKGDYEPTVNSKLGWHIQRKVDIGPDGQLHPVLDYIQRSKAQGDGQRTYVKVMGDCLNPDSIKAIRTVCPNAFLIGRKHADNQPYGNPEQDAANLVAAIAETGCGPLVDAWESWNEQAVSTLTPQQVQSLDRFYVAFHRLVRERFGVQITIALNSPTGNLGWPNEVSPADFTLSLAEPDIWFSFHCYEWPVAPGSDRQAFLFRFVRLMQQAQAKAPGKKFILTEAGMTEAVLSGHPDRGWNRPDGVPRDHLLQVLRDLDAEAQKYPALQAVLVFQTGGNDDWSTHESAAEVAQLRLERRFQRPIDVIRDDDEAETEEDTPTTPPTEVHNNAQAYGVSIVPLTQLKKGDVYYRCIEVTHLSADDNSGNHHIFADVVDEHDRRIMGAVIEVRDSFGNAFTATVDKPADEPGTNYPMWGHETNPPNYRTVLVRGFLSDAVVGIHPAHPGEYKADGTLGNTLFHHSFFLKFKREVYGGENTDEELPITDLPVHEYGSVVEAATAAAYEALGIPFNPTFAFPQKAIAEGLGPPRTGEFDWWYSAYPDAPLQRKRQQVFGAGSLVADVSDDGLQGDWDHIAVIRS